MTAHGSLFYLMGASGSGKDTLLDASLVRLEASPDWRSHLPRRVQRYITRPAEAGGEAHHAVSEDQFTALVKEDRFCLLWQAHGLSYGIDREILDWLAAGDNVLVNGSRAYLPQASRLVPGLVAILIDVPPDVRKQRLQNRARESGDALDSRMQRTVELDTDDVPVHRIDNDQALEKSAEDLCQLIVRLSTQQRA